MNNALNGLKCSTAALLRLLDKAAGWDVVRLVITVITQTASNSITTVAVGAVAPVDGAPIRAV